ncbi:alpha-mannosidase [Leptodesmis sp.]|uniref:alpha-mannosidase n=1 Tax=Leptodesmis sp. TaxID=3100501 RepID=UPI0040535821
MSKPVLSPSEQISDTIARLRDLSQVSVQLGWRYYDGDLPLADALNQPNWQHWTAGTVNDRDHHPWVKGRKVRWFSQILQVPQNLHGFPLEGLCLRLALLWWAEQAQVYVNGQLVQEGDLFDCAPRLLLSPAVQVGDEFAIALRFISPSHDDGALMKSVCHYEAPSPNHPPEPAFVADEIAVLHSYLETFQPDQLDTLATALSQINWPTLTPPLPHSPHPFTFSLLHLRQTLLPLAEPIRQRQITLLGHAHLDMAWLWTVKETWKAAERTFQSVLNLQKDFPELTFCHTTPALYEWMEQHRPDLFAQIQAQVKVGRWEVVAGFWIEPELNLISGESIVRQVLYGQRYLQEKFGSICPIAWVPDTFGFTWQLPQILKQGGVDYFVTQKLRWNDTTKFPYELFQWQAPDGTQILSLMSAPIGEGIDPVKMTSFLWDLEQKTGLRTLLWLPGVGDHGGGPTRDMLEVARRWQQSPFFPHLKFGTAQEYLEEIQNSKFKIQNSDLPNPQSPPTWNSDLYLEYHRGCYTTHADQKQANRRSEELLYQAELWASLATIATQLPYPKSDIEVAWKQTLFNQFHDILPGSSITPVFEEANQQWQQVQAIGTKILQQSLQAIAQQITLPPPPHPAAKPIVVFNSLNWVRSQVIDLEIQQSDQSTGWQICDVDGSLIAQQHFSLEVGQGKLSFLAENVPAIGYRTYWLCPAQANPVHAVSSPSDYRLENDYLRITVSSDSGELVSVFDKPNQREVLSGAGNQLQAFTDQGQYWDAWNIDPNYAQHPLPAPKLQQIEWMEQNDVRSRLRVVRILNCSTFTQDYILETGSPLLKIETTVDWQERHVLVKAAFPLNLEADFATYEIPCAVIQRTTRPQTAAEKAQWEVPALHWADLTDVGSPIALPHSPTPPFPYGLTLLNDCKYGYDAQPDQLRLTLLRGTTWPDPEADRGQHHFTYALYPHRGDWKAAQTVRQGYELNLPLQVILISEPEHTLEKILPSSGSLLNLEAKNLVLMALKPAEDHADEWILRCSECHGESARLQVCSEVFNVRCEYPVDVLERPIDAAIASEQTPTIAPWEIASFRVRLSR